MIEGPEDMALAFRFLEPCAYIDHGTPYMISVDVVLIIVGRGPPNPVRHRARQDHAERRDSPSAARLNNEPQRRARSGVVQIDQFAEQVHELFALIGR
jgi:hypothetical protein